MSSRSAPRGTGARRARASRNSRGADEQKRRFQLQLDRHDYAHGVSVELTFIECALDSVAFAPGEAVHALRWERPQDIALEDLLEADRPFIRSLAAGTATESTQEGR